MELPQRIKEVAHVGGHVGVRLRVRHDAAALRVSPAAQERRGGYNHGVRVGVHADGEVAAARLRRVSGAREVAGAGAELGWVVGLHAAEALHHVETRKRQRRYRTLLL